MNAQDYKMPHKRSAKLLLTIGFALILAFIMPIGLVAFTELQKTLGLKKVAVPVVGTGSMYPSLYWEVSEGGPEDPSAQAVEEYRSTPYMYHFSEGFNIGNKTYFNKSIKRGDMIAFRNDATRTILENEGRNTDAGFIKRVVAIAGDTIEIRDGFVYVNDLLIDEPYTYKPRSTYGGTKISDCQVVEISEQKIFVLGDNRKVSSDSRYDIGLIDVSDVNFILPLSEQSNYHVNWRDATDDDRLASQPTLNQQEFINLLNGQRKNASSTLLASNSLLANSSILRAKKIIMTNDASTEASKSGYTMSTALADVGYSNIVTGEILSVGYFSAEELIQNLLHFPETHAQVVDSKYEEIGIGVANGEINGCPTQVVVGHFGGYLPAQYDQDSINSWKKLLDNLNEIIPSWEEARDNSTIDQVKLQELLSNLYERRTLASEVYNAMTSKEWFSEELKDRIAIDNINSKKVVSLTKELNNK